MPTEGTRKSERQQDKKAPAENAQKTSERRLVQTSLHASPIVKDAQNKPTSSSDSQDLDSPCGTPDILTELNRIQQSLSEIRQTMVNKNDVKELVTSIITEVKSELKQELKEEILTEIKQTVKSEITDKFEEKLDQKIESKTKDFERQVKDTADGFNLDMETMKENFAQHNRELRTLKENLKQCQFMAREAIQLSNQNQQYSQKNNIKFLGWKESRNEDLRTDLCNILKQKTGIELDPKDVLAIHRLPHGKQGPRPVIAKFVSSEIKVNVIKKRSNEDLKKCFLMVDHITPRNAKLINVLKEDSRIISAWFYNGKVFALDKDNNRHKFDILDSVDDKVKR